MHTNQIQAEALAEQMMAICRRGFVNEHAWKAWLRKHEREIAALPQALRDAVLLAHDQASAKEFSR